MAEAKLIAPAASGGIWPAGNVAMLASGSCAERGQADHLHLIGAGRADVREVVGERDLVGTLSDVGGRGDDRRGGGVDHVDDVFFRVGDESPASAGREGDGAQSRLGVDAPGHLVAFASITAIEPSRSTT